jgi:hypothetical protein
MEIVIDKMIPACVTYDPAQLKTLSDAAYLLQQQDGCLSFAECSRVRTALRSVKYVMRIQERQERA